jgi:hypothetical protein
MTNENSKTRKTRGKTKEEDPQEGGLMKRSSKFSASTYCL